MAQANTFAKRFEGSRYWPDRAWDTAIVLDNPAQRGEHHDELLERASWFYEAVSFSEAMKSQTPGAGQAYLGRTPMRRAHGSTAHSPTRCTSPPTRPPSSSGQPRSTT